MLGNHSTHRVVSFGPFEADLQTQELRKQGVRLRPAAQSFQVLKMLLERPGELVAREDLQKALWPSDTFVDFEHGVNAAVNRLREAIGDSADHPVFIETLPRRGYKFIVSVEAPFNPKTQEPRSSSPEDRPQEKPLPKRRGVIAATVALLLIGVGVAYWYSQPRPPTVVNIVQLTNDGKPKLPANSPATDGVHLCFRRFMPSI
jgi:DNA-binding winged helix-turn-helix (wHTH) protein